MLKREQYYVSLDYHPWIVINQEYAFVHFADRWFCMNDQWAGDHADMEKRVNALQNASEFFEFVELNKSDSHEISSLPVTISNEQIVFEACALASAYDVTTLDVVNTVSINMNDL